MALERLQVNHLRNLLNVQINPINGFNLIVGANGSGKTSLLESIYYLSLARSFRSRQNRSVISFGQDRLIVHAKLQQTRIGLEKSREGSSRVRINGNDKSSASQLAELLPVLLINADSYQLLTGPAKFRRQFLDWGVFHVEHSFIQTWQDSCRIIKQRNSALRSLAKDEDLLVWTNALIPVAEALDKLRQDYLEAFMRIFKTIVKRLLDIDVSFVYQAGWRGDLATQLSNDLFRDKQLGYTQHGPHRADISLKHQQYLIKDIFSRGQQKLLFFALKLAQGIFLYEKTGKSCVYLIDDLAAELDERKRNLVVNMLMDMKAQVFVTGVDEASITHFTEIENSKLFHVEQGMISEIN